MKRWDFKEIKDEHFNICEKLSTNNGNCVHIACLKCPFDRGNSIYNKGCLDSKYKIKNGIYYKDEELVKSAKEFLKFREEKNMKDIFMYNGEIYEKVSEYEDLITAKKVNWYKYIYNALSICEQGESGFFIRRDHKGLYYCEPYTQDYNTTEAILCCNDGYRIEVILAILNNVCPDFNDVAKLIKDL